MNRIDRVMPDYTTKDFVLATDLDGTFLGGSEADRRRLYDWIEESRDTVGLIFVTGRDPEFIGELCDSGVPWPDYVVGDVGTTIAHVDRGDIRPITALEAEIAEVWGNAGETVRAALGDHPGLTLQPTAFRYRVSYDLDPAAFDHSARDKVVALGHDALISDNRFFDVLPRGVSKGPSLKRLLAHLGVAEDRVLAAGDTLNDLSMLISGLPAVAVGGAEQALLAEVDPLPHVHKARAIGAAGILEAIAAFDLHPLPEGI
ncbi:MAG: HAD-IIB family hydrolase [Rhodobacteraceae bacterium]|nr:HAD-IIB family hydrolase [Paracoccaceae bacterium]